MQQSVHARLCTHVYIYIDIHIYIYIYARVIIQEMWQPGLLLSTLFGLQAFLFMLTVPQGLKQFRS